MNSLFPAYTSSYNKNVVNVNILTAQNYYIKFNLIELVRRCVNHPHSPCPVPPNRPHILLSRRPFEFLFLINLEKKKPTGSWMSSGREAFKVEQGQAVPNEKPVLLFSILWLLPLFLARPVCYASSGFRAWFSQFYFLFQQEEFKMSLLLPFTSTARQQEKGETPVPSLCNDCALRFTEERRKDSQSTEPLCAHQATSPAGTEREAWVEAVLVVNKNETSEWPPPFGPACCTHTKHKCLNCCMHLYFMKWKTSARQNICFKWIGWEKGTQAGEQWFSSPERVGRAKIAVVSHEEPDKGAGDEQKARRDVFFCLPWWLNISSTTRIITSFTPQVPAGQIHTFCIFPPVWTFPWFILLLLFFIRFESSDICLAG